MTKRDKIKRVKELGAQYKNASAAKKLHYSSGEWDGSVARNLNCLMCDLENEACQLGMGSNGVYHTFLKEAGLA